MDLYAGVAGLLSHGITTAFPKWGISEGSSCRRFLNMAQIPSKPITSWARFTPAVAAFIAHSAEMGVKDAMVNNLKPYLSDTHAENTGCLLGAVSHELIENVANRAYFRQCCLDPRNNGSFPRAMWFAWGATTLGEWAMLKGYERGQSSQEKIAFGTLGSAFVGFISSPLILFRNCQFAGLKLTDFVRNQRAETQGKRMRFELNFCS